MSEKKGSEAAQGALHCLQGVVDGGTGGWGTAAVSVTDRVVTTNELPTLLKQATGGWLCTGGGVYKIGFGGDLIHISGDEQPLLDQVLSAEWTVGDMESIHLRRQDDQLYLWAYCEGNGQDSLWKDELFVSTERPLTLRYRTYWQLKESEGLEVWQPAFARFLGWGKE